MADDKVIIVIPGQNPQGTPTAGDQARPYWLPGPQEWAREQVQQHHDEALYRYGEYSMFVLMWRREDYDAGLVTRCSTCFVPYDGIAEVFQQPARERCPNCFGTSYEGGYKARIVRPALWANDSENHLRRERGEVIEGRSQVQSTSDFRMRNGDFIFRQSGVRWSVSNTDTDYLTTGFAPEGPGVGNVALNLGTVVREDEGTVAYDIPPATPLLISQLSITGPAYPYDFTDVEDIRGPLFPSDYKPEA